MLVNDRLPNLRCPACRHEVAYVDSVRNVGGRRFHADCIDAHRADPTTGGGSLGVFARYIERFSQVLRR
jgi:hypothetical protein